VIRETVVVLPALNEAGCVREAVARWRALDPLEVRVVDNGSSDATADEARAAGALLLREPRRGYGAAAWRGIQQLPPACRAVIFASADGSDRLDGGDLEIWMREAQRGAELILGDRVSRAQAREHLKAIQSVGNRLCCVLIELGWGRRFRDMGSLRWIRRDALELLALRDRGFGWNVEMQVRSLERGLRIVELPVTYHARTAGESKISGSWRGTARAGAEILRMFWALHHSRTARERLDREDQREAAVLERANPARVVEAERRAGREIELVAVAQRD
jgi:hypothetical protein